MTVNIRSFEYGVKLLGSFIIPANKGSGKILTSGAEGEAEWKEPEKKKLRIGHTFGIQGEVTTAVIPGFSISLSTGQESKLVKVRYKIVEGTSVSFRLQKNGSDITGFGTSGSPLKAETSAASTEPTAIELAENDIITALVSAVSGSPKNLSITIFEEYII